MLVVGEVQRPRKRVGGIVWFASEVPGDARTAIDSLVPDGFRHATRWTRRALEIGTADDLDLLVEDAGGWDRVREQMQTFVAAANAVHPVVLYAGGAAARTLQEHAGAEDALHALLSDVLTAPALGERTNAAWTLDVVGPDLSDPTRWAAVTAATLGESFRTDRDLLSSWVRRGQGELLARHCPSPDVIALLSLKGTALRPRGNVAVAVRQRLRHLDGARGAVAPDWLAHAAHAVLRAAILPETSAEIARWYIERDVELLFGQALFGALLPVDAVLARSIARKWVADEPGSHDARAALLHLAIVCGDVPEQLSQVDWVEANTTTNATLVLNVLYVLHERRDFARASRLAKRYLAGPRVVEHDVLQNNIMNAFTGCGDAEMEDAVAAMIERRREKTGLHQAILAAYYARRGRGADAARACVDALEAGYAAATLMADNDLVRIIETPAVAARLRGSARS